MNVSFCVMMFQSLSSSAVGVFGSGKESSLSRRLPSRRIVVVGSVMISLEIELLAAVMVWKVVSSSSLEMIMHNDHAALFCNLILKCLPV